MNTAPVHFPDADIFTTEPKIVKKDENVSAVTSDMKPYNSFQLTSPIKALSTPSPGKRLHQSNHMICSISEHLDSNIMRTLSNTGF